MMRTFASKCWALCSKCLVKKRISAKRYTGFSFLFWTFRGRFNSVQNSQFLLDLNLIYSSCYDNVYLKPQGEKLRTVLIALYFNPEELPSKTNKDVPKKVSDACANVFLHRANKTLFDMQCLMDVNGATDLVIDLIMSEPSPNIFLECIQLAIALLNGGNGAVQVGTNTEFNIS